MLGLSQKETAPLIPKHWKTLQNWEKKDRLAPPDAYRTLAAFYSERLQREVSVSWILFEVGPGPRLDSPPNQPDGLNYVQALVMDLEKRTDDRLSRELAKVELSFNRRLDELRDEIHARIERGEGMPMALRSHH